MPSRVASGLKIHENHTGKASQRTQGNPKRIAAAQKILRLRLPCNIPSASRRTSLHCPIPLRASYFLKNNSSRFQVTRYGVSTEGRKLPIPARTAAYEKGATVYIIGNSSARMIWTSSNAFFRWLKSRGCICASISSSIRASHGVEGVFLNG